MGPKDQLSEGKITLKKSRAR